MIVTGQPMSIEEMLAQPSPRPMLNVGPAPADPLTAALAGGKSADGSALSDTLAQSLIKQSGRGQNTPFEALSNLAMLASGTRAEDRYLKDSEARKNAPFDALQAALVGKSPAEIRAALPSLMMNDPSMFAAGAQLMMKEPDEQWSQVTVDGRTGQQSSTSNLINWDPAKPSPAGDKSPLGDLIAERNAIAAVDPNHPDLKSYDAAIAKATAVDGGAADKPTLTEIEDPTQPGSGIKVKAYVWPDGKTQVVGVDVAAPTAPPEFIRTLDERNKRFAANPDDPSLKIIDAKIANDIAKTGIRIETTPDVIPPSRMKNLWDWFPRRLLIEWAAASEPASPTPTANLLSAWAPIRVPPRLATMRLLMPIGVLPSARLRLQRRRVSTPALMAAVSISTLKMSWQLGRKQIRCLLT